MSEFRPLRIAVAGPHRAAAISKRKANLNEMNQAAARLFITRFISLIGVNPALPLVDQAGMSDPEDGMPSAEQRAAIMDISMALCTSQLSRTRDPKE